MALTTNLRRFQAHCTLHKVFTVHPVTSVPILQIFAHMAKPPKKICFTYFASINNPMISFKYSQQEKMKTTYKRQDFEVTGLRLIETTFMEVCAFKGFRFRIRAPLPKMWQLYLLVSMGNVIKNQKQTSFPFK